MTTHRLAILAACTAALSLAQEFRASVSGIVSDPSGAPVVDARILVTSVERNVVYDAVSNASGYYLVQFLPAGRYTLVVEKTGFKKYLRESIALIAADKVNIDPRLELGSVTESVNVSDHVSLLQTETASRTGTIDNRTLENVPSGGRNAYALQYNLPGVVKSSTYWGSMELYAFGNVNGVQIGGGRSGENETVVDGVTNTKSDRGVSFVPSINSTQEFTVQTNSYDAQFGRVGGGVSIITLKSGTNQFHGQLFEYLKNEKLRAMDWAANKQGASATPFKNNTFGFEVDGPIWVPKLYNGRNKAFFMLSLEGLREHSAGGQLRTLPTEAMKQGDFSKLLNGSGALVSVYDPLTNQLQANGQYARTPFAGNVIPTVRINAVAANVAKFYPKANLPGDGPALINNYAKVLPTTNGYDAWLGKLDYNFSDRSRMSFRYGQTPWLNFAQLVWGDNAAEPSGQYPSTRVSRNWGADWTHTISPSMVFNLRGGLARYEGFSGNGFGGGFDPRQLGFPSALVSQFTRLQFPRFNLGAYSELGANQVSGYTTNDTYSIQPNMSWTRGRHFLKYGAELRRYNNNSISPGAASGAYTFDKGWTQQNPLRGDAASGNEFASFLLGYAASGNVPRNIDAAFQNRYYALFLQDDFKVNGRLTLNLGLRWDYETPYYERHDRMINGFAFDQASPLASQAPSLTLKGGLQFAGVNDSSRYAFDPKHGAVQPRIGAAYKLTNKWVLRGGFGVSYLGQSSAGPTGGFSRTTNMITSTDGNLTPSATLSDPFPSAQFPSGLLQPVGNTLGLATNLGQAVSAPYRDRPLPYSLQYSFGFQRELPDGWLLDASYVGNITHRLPVSLNLNFIPLATLTSLPVEQRTAYFTGQVANPLAGLLPGTALNGATIARQVLTYAYPHFAQVTATDVPIGAQRYDSLQVKLNRRFAKGLTMTVSFTLAKTLEQIAPLVAQDVDLSNLTNTRLEKRLTQYDVPRQISFIGSYDLPVGRGRHYLNAIPKALDGVVGGWTFSGVYMTHSGYPFDFPNAAPLAARSAKLTDAQRDELARKNGRSQFDPSYDKYFDTTLFPGTAGPAAFTLRNFPTRFPDVRSKPLNVIDFSAYKEFRFFEKVRWQIRLDAHNLANFPWFASLQTNNVTNAQFGQLQADAKNELRVLVAVMKVVF